MIIEINIGGFVSYLLGLRLAGDDTATVIGHSRLAYLSQRDRGQAFMPACVWHDAAYSKGASIQGCDGMSRFQVDQEFLKKMLDIAKDDFELEREACELYLLVRKFGAELYEGPQR